jgi:hypothetical protein
MPDLAAINSLNNKIFLSGPAGSGKTTLAIDRLRALIDASIDGGSILVIAPQRSLLKPYQQLLRRADLPAGEQIEALTIGGLARRTIDLLWPTIAAQAKFTHPDQPPTFLTLETAQYYMEKVVAPLISERLYFEGVRVPGQRLYSQLIDNLNKAALVGFDYHQVGRKLIDAWEGPSGQTITFAQVQDCINRFRDYCYANNLLDFSLQVELFVELTKSAAFRDRLFKKYRHLMVDNIEEDTPITHDLLRDWIPAADSALIVFDNDAGYRSFLGADPRSAYTLRSVCEHTIELSDSHVMSIELISLEEKINKYLLPEVDLPTRTSKKPLAKVESENSPSALNPSQGSEEGITSSNLAKGLTGDQDRATQPFDRLRAGSSQGSPLAFGGGRFHPQMLDWVAREVNDLINNKNVAPNEIVILAPFLSDSLRFALQDRLDRSAIPTRSLRPSRALNEESITRGLMTLSALAHPDWKIAPPQSDVAQMFVMSIDELDPARAHLIAERLYRSRDGQIELRAFDILKAELQDRIGYEVGAKVERIRGWISDRVKDETVLPLDHFLSKLFGEVLSQDGYGFHRQIDPGRITAQIAESARKFRQTVSRDPFAAAIDPNIGRDYVRLVAEGIVAATYVESPYAETSNAVLLAPAYTFLLSNESVGYQFWLNAGSPAWWERLYQPLTHPYVLSRSWENGQKWTDEAEQSARQKTLLRLLRGLIRRCRSKIYLAMSTLNEQGFEERGPLLSIVQQVLRETNSE